MLHTLIETTKILIQDNPNQLAVLSNISALIYQEIPDLNWVGFYVYHEQYLYLGPFQGKPATTLIPLSRGVCGEAARTLKTINVYDVHQHPDHIACDEASNSELVIPVILDGQLFGVLDIDSPVIGRFDAMLQHTLETVVELLTVSIDNKPFLK
jgi:GAF domain-containing protein